mgnify:CR=1 FL=1
MSTVNQIYTLINEVAQQTFGESAITVKDTSTLVALGDKVLSSDKDTDKFAKSLVDRIGRTIFSKLTQLKKALSPMHSTPSGITIEERFSLVSNA